MSAEMEGAGEESTKANIDEERDIECPEGDDHVDSDVEDTSKSDSNLSKAERKRKRYEKLVAHQKEQRKRLRAARKEKQPKERQPEEGRIPKKERLKLIKSRMQEALKDGQRICVDLSLEAHMSRKECSRLAQQLCRLYGSNRSAEAPAHVYFAGLNKTGHLYQECVRKNSGFDSYIVDISEQSPFEIFDKTDIVYLTPDSPNVLEGIDRSKVYILGGLVDESITKNITLSKAKELDIATARLPIEEYMVRATNVSSYSKVLAINQVFDILLTFMSTGDWTKALSVGVPQRMGYILPETKDSIKKTLTTCDEPQ